MLDYIIVVSTPNAEQDNGKPSKEERKEIQLQTLVSRRAELLRQLHREAISIPPHSNDEPMHYASIASMVVRHSRRINYSAQSSDPADTHFNNFCSKSMEVEEQALLRVSELAKRPRRDHHHTTETRVVSGVISPAASPPPVLSSPTSPTSEHRERKVSLQSKRRRSRRDARPQTAPGDSEGRSTSPPDISVPSSPTASHTITRMFSRSSLSSKYSGHIPSSTEDMSFEGEPRSLPVTRPTLMHHPRSTSTDSALFRKSNHMNVSSSSSVSHVVIEGGLPDSTDDPGRKRKGLLRGILVRR